MTTKIKDHRFEIGDTFHDVREGRSGTVNIIGKTEAGPFYCIEASDPTSFESRPFVSEPLLLEITGGAAPFSTGNDGSDKDYDYFEPEELVPAESLTTHLRTKADGGIEISYHAWADAWGLPHDIQPQALQNHVRGSIHFAEASPGIADAAAEEIGLSLYPYRLSPDTFVSASPVPPKLTFLGRLKEKVFGGSDTKESDEKVELVEAALTKLAQASPSSDTPVYTDW